MDKTSWERSLCNRCTWKKDIKTKRSTFFLCQFSQEQQGWPKYPIQPVLRCPAFQEKETLTD